MDIFVIASLVVGVILVVLGYIIPVNKEESIEKTRELAKEEIATLVSLEMDRVKEQLDSVVNETVGYAVGKTERSLERISNEKIMAVNEYSDTVMHDIHKNHEEVVFLYDMLNDKHKSLKNTVSEINKTVKTVQDAVQTIEKEKAESEEAYSFFQPKTKESTVPEKKAEANVASESVEPANQMPVEPAEPAQDPVMSEQSTNSNEKILELYSQGKSKVAIAKELGLGVGEVKLVIDLNKNAKN